MFSFFTGESSETLFPTFSKWVVLSPKPLVYRERGQAQREADAEVYSWGLFSQSMSIGDFFAEDKGLSTIAWEMANNELHEFSPCPRKLAVLEVAATLAEVPSVEDFLVKALLSEGVHFIPETEEAQVEALDMAERETWWMNYTSVCDMGTVQPQVVVNRA